MDIIIEILKNYWQPILAALLFVLSFILQLIKKKPIQDIDSVIFKYAIVAVSKAEQSDKKGVEKLELALHLLSGYILDIYPDLDFSRYCEYSRKIIEAILSTPQKKGVCEDGEKKTNG